jgi:hypothetical protein
MAGDWIKMKINLGRSPKVVRIASALCLHRLTVVGALHAIWSLFDEHATEGRLDGYTLESVDDYLALPGFSAALRDVGWLRSDELSLVIDQFDVHNGQSAKRRAQEAERKRFARSAGASDADDERTREEKRRPNSPPPPVDTGGAQKSVRQRRVPRGKTGWQVEWQTVVERGEVLGIPYTTDALGTSYTSEDEGDHKRRYRAHVIERHNQVTGEELRQP